MADHRDASAEPSAEPGDLLRFGTIASVDLVAKKCTVESGDLLTGPVKWFEARAGRTRSWSPPSVGEQVLLISPDGAVAGAVALRGIPSNAYPAPGNSLRELLEFDDGAVIAYDPEAHKLDAMLPDGATVHLVASGGFTLDGDVTVNGKVTVRDKLDAGEDVTTGGISLKNHKHGQVQAGGAVSGKPL